MKAGRISTGLAVLFGLLSLYLGYATLDLATWNDDLKQGAEHNRTSRHDLLAYVAANSNCDVTARQLAEAMNAHRKERALPFEIYPQENGSVEVARLAFRAIFENDRLRSVGDINHGDVLVCGN